MATIIAWNNSLFSFKNYQNVENLWKHVKTCENSWNPSWFLTNCEKIVWLKVVITVWKDILVLWDDQYIEFHGKKLVFCFQNCPDLLWEKKTCSSYWEKRLKCEAKGQNFEITRTIYSNSERSEQFLKQNAFFKINHSQI